MQRMTTDQLRHETLAPIYEAAGFANYTREYTARIVQFLQEQGWAGRLILDMGCGIGVSTEIFARHNMAVTAVDNSTAMLARARERLEGAQYDVQFVQENLQNYTPLANQFDMAFCLDVVSHITNVRDLESIFQRANWGLPKGKVFVFDFQTVRGLAQDIGGQKTQILFNDEQLFVVVRNLFDYDGPILRRYYSVFQRQASGQFTRNEAAETLRGYPYQAIEGMLKRSKFEIQFALDLDFKPFDGTNDPHGRVIIVAQKMQDFKLNS
jgi:SAM-dependent methyltransferase